MDSKRKNKKLMISWVMFFIGLCIFLYPWISFRLTKSNQINVINDYISVVDTFSDEELEEQRNLVEQYNEEVKNTKWTEEELSYMELIKPGTVIGYIEIPKIGVYCPIYQDIADEYLEEGIGHIIKTSLPSDSKSSHSALTGHRGLPSSELFSDLDKLEDGDTFTICSLGKEYVYKVDKISVVLPDDSDPLKIVENHNYVTLVTCTPYMINTHRLLVRGELISVSDSYRDVNKYLHDISDKEDKTEKELKEILGLDKDSEKDSNKDGNSDIDSELVAQYGEDIDAETMKKLKEQNENYRVAYEKYQGYLKTGKSFDKYQLFTQTETGKEISKTYFVMGLGWIFILIIILIIRWILMRRKGGDNLEK